MSRPVSNPQQLLASHPEKHIWVAASAGSGKTKVLTDRVLRLLLQRTPPSQILCITYTKAAASEMQTRIHDTLGRWVMQDDATLHEELYAVSGETPTPAILVYARSLFARLLEHVPGLRIQTIHAFCQSILARFPLEAGVPAHFQILDERSQQELLQEAQIWLLQHGLDSHTASPDTATDTTDTTTALTQALHVLSLELGESKFKDVIHSIIHNRTKIEQTLIQLNNKIDTNTNALDVDFSPTASPLCAELYRRLELDISFTSRDDILRHYFPHDAHARRILQDVAEGFTAFGTDTEKKNTAFFYEMAQAAALTDTLREKYVQFFFTDKGEPRSTKGFPTGKVKDNAPWIADWIARETDKMLAFRKDCGAFQTAYQSYYMVVLAQALFARYRRLKDVRGWLDYEDIIIHTRNLLCGERMMPWVLFKLDEGISHILVDEAQDTSPLQWELIGAIASEFFSGEGAREQQRTLFVVGDEKQSIYRFQGADVASFMRMREQLRQQVKASGDTLHIVRLAMSFRSCPAVLEAVDAVFRDAHARQGLADMHDDTPIQHQAFRASAQGLVEVWPLIQVIREKKKEWFPIADSYHDTHDAIMLLAQRIATTIADWIHHKRPLHAKNRPVTAGDILILVRRRNRLVNCISRELKKRGVAVAGLDRMVLTSHFAIKDLLALGQFLLLPEDDLTLAALLRSPLYSLSEETLFELCYNRHKDSVWSRVKAYTGADSLVYAAKEELSALLARTDFMTPYALFADVLYARGGRARLMARMGEEVTDPLSVFLAEAMHYEQLHAPNLQGFLHWISCGESMVKRDLEQGVNAVRIMTVHGSKGLQAPIVILPDTTSTPQNTGDPIMTDAPSDGSLSLAYMMPLTQDDTTLTRAMRDANKQATTEEYHRLLYVALTRAEDELYLCGTEGTKASPKDCWYNMARHAIQSLEGVTTLPAAQAYSAWEKTDGDVLRYSHIPLHSHTQETATDVAHAASVLHTTDIPAWLRTHAPSEPTPPRPLAPSRLYAEEPAAILPETRQDVYPHSAVARGLLIHRLLHILSTVTAHHRHAFSIKYLQQHAKQWDDTQREAVIQEVLNVLQHPEFHAVFSEGSMAEVPLAGTIRDNIVISGQVDRLVVTPEEVLVVDFKTGTPPAHKRIPEAYKVQMEAYHDLLAKIYPHHAIRCALIYTATAELIPVVF